MSIVARWRGVSKRYGALSAVEEVSLALGTGEIMALVGHNGAGKTTLIKLLLGLVRPSAGSVELLGVDPAGPRGPLARQQLGFLPENVAFHGAMNAFESMAFYARLKGCEPARNAALLERVGIARAARRRVATYSKGMLQRLGIAQALIGEPRLLLLDEPTSGLDPASRLEMYDTIGQLRAEGVTLLICTHALAEVERRVDRVAIMHGGRLLAAGAPSELRAELAPNIRMVVRPRADALARVRSALPAGLEAAWQEPALVIETPAARKLEVLRAIVALGDAVEDVEWTGPGLEQLYRQLVEAKGVPRATA